MNFKQICYIGNIPQEREVQCVLHGLGLWSSHAHCLYSIYVVWNYFGFIQLGGISVHIMLIKIVFFKKHFSDLNWWCFSPNWRFPVRCFSLSWWSLLLVRLLPHTDSTSQFKSKDFYVGKKKKVISWYYPLAVSTHTLAFIRHLNCILKPSDHNISVYRIVIQLSKVWPAWILFFLHIFFF